MVTATFLTEDSYLGSQTEPLTLNRYNYCVSSYLNYTDPSGNEVEVLESLKGWIIDPDTQAQKTIENYENQRLSLEDAIESGLLNNRAGQIFLDYGDVIMGPPVTLPSSLVGIREAIKGNSDSEEMQRTATAGFYAGFVGQGLEYVQIISKADYQLSLLIVTQKGLNAAANPLTYVEYFRNFSPQEKLEAAKRTAKGAWNGDHDSALGRKTGAAILDYLLVAIGGALMKGESAACEVAESGTPSGFYQDANGRWHRPNGDFASNAEVGIASPAKTATGSHGNSLSDPRTNYGYVLVDKDTNEILKFGETLYPETRYSKSYLEQNNAVMKVLESGSKEYIHYWQYDMNKYFEYMYDEFPPLLKSKGW